MFAFEPGMTVQLVTSDGKCWQSNLSQAKKNTPEKFNGKGN